MNRSLCSVGTTNPWKCWTNFQSFSSRTKTQLSRVDYCMLCTATLWALPMRSRSPDPIFRLPFLVVFKERTSKHSLLIISTTLRTEYNKQLIPRCHILIYNHLPTWTLPFGRNLKSAPKQSQCISNVPIRLWWTRRWLSASKSNRQMLWYHLDLKST